MKILHVIPPYCMDDEVLDNALLWMGSMLEMTDIHIVAFEKDIQKAGTLPVTCHALYRSHPLKNRLYVATQYVKVLYKVMPDIVHIHGSWNLFGADVERWSRRRGFKVIVSPHGRLRKHTWNWAFIKTRFLLGITYQRRMIRHCCALHATNEKEKHELKALKWNQKITIATLQQPHLMLAFYQRIIDRDVHRQMSVDERQALCYLLHTALSGDLRQAYSHSVKRIERLTKEQWRRIFLYAREENVVDILQKGIEIERLQIPSGVTPDNTFTTSSKQVNREKGIVGMLGEIRKHIKKGSVNLRHLSELYQAFLQLDCDEDELAEELRAKKIDRFTARMEQVLSEIFFLTEGFMPIEKQNDRHTERIRKRIILKSSTYEKEV